eukprot:tig00000076_g2381.t1
MTAGPALPAIPALPAGLPPGLEVGGRLAGGNTNDVYSARWNDGDVILRVYGSHPIDRDRELQAMLALAESRICPRVLFEFEGGRVEEMARGVSPEPADVRRPDIMKSVAEALARLHQTRVPGADQHPQLWAVVQDWAARAAGLPAYQAVLKGTGVSDLRAEAGRLRAQFESMGAASFDVGFCHNDLNTPNLLVEGESVTLIDFEYAGTNYISFDIANFLNELGYNYKVTTPPGFEICPPATEDEKRLFVRCYLQRRSGAEPSPGEIALLMRQVALMSIVSHLQWVCWSVCRAENAASEPTVLDFVEYARHRLTALHDGFRIAFET